MVTRTDPLGRHCVGRSASYDRRHVITILVIVVVEGNIEGGQLIPEVVFCATQTAVTGSYRPTNAVIPLDRRAVVMSLWPSTTH